MIRIQKSDAKKLNKEYHVPYGENGISCTKGNHHKHYYLCESEQNLRLLTSITVNDEAERLLKEMKKHNRFYRRY